jgi:hypothetical protein
MVDDIVLKKRKYTGLDESYTAYKKTHAFVLQCEDVWFSELVEYLLHRLASAETEVLGRCDLRRGCRRGEQPQHHLLGLVHGGPLGFQVLSK